MARVQFTISDEDRDRLVEQARQEGKTLSAWLRRAVRELLERREFARPGETQPDVPVSPKGNLVDITPFFKDLPPRPEIGDKEGWRQYFEKLEGKPRPKPFETEEEIRAFFEEMDKRRGPSSDLEPDWEDVKQAMSDDLLQRLPKT